MSIEIKYDNNILKALEKALKRIPSVKVGVFQQNNSREDGKTNAEIGVYHEYGTKNLPIRSFLRMPLMNHFNQYLENAGALDEETLKNIVDEKSALQFVAKMGFVAEEVVDDAFNTGGFGEWPSSDMRYKKNKQTLIETRQLQRSIASEVVE